MEYQINLKDSEGNISEICKFDYFPASDSTAWDFITTVCDHANMTQDRTVSGEYMVHKTRFDSDEIGALVATIKF